MELKEYQGTSKTGKPFTAYRVEIGKYKCPLFFPSEIELMYIKSIINKQARDDFKKDLIDEIGEQLPYEN